MPAYHISGPSGSGKSHVGRELGGRGFRIIETDFEPGLASWVNYETGQKVEVSPNPYTEDWLQAHGWLWDALKMQELVEESRDEPVFFVGGAYNQKDFVGLFHKRFGLYVDTPTLVARLRPREPGRWAEGSPELQRTVEWNERSKQFEQATGAILIDGSLPAELVADTILSHLQA